VVDPDRTERPAARLIRTYGPRFKTPHAKPEATVAFDYDRDAHAGGYWWTAFHDGAAAYREAVRQGKMITVFTPGTGKNSDNVPPVAVGNVPCNGSNPPKYLDAEFNFLRVRDADGIWREADDGAEISASVAHPIRVRASLGNLQEATWLAMNENDVAPERGVALVLRTSDGKCVATVPLKTDVPPLADADLGEFDLPCPSGGLVVLTARLETRGRFHTPFGARRVFAIRKQ
jgi:hypothetical protein